MKIKIETSRIYEYLDGNILEQNSLTIIFVRIKKDEDDVRWNSLSMKHAIQTCMLACMSTSHNLRVQIIESL